RMTRTSWNCATKRRQAGTGALAVSWLGPWRSSLARASASLSPACGSVPSAARISSTSRRQASSRPGTSVAVSATVAGREAGGRAVTGALLPSARAKRLDHPAQRFVGGRAVLRQPVPVGGGERLAQARRVVVPRVARRAGLVPPRVLEASGVHRIEAELVDKLHHLRAGVRRIAGDGQGDAIRRALRPRLLDEVRRVDVVERIDHRAPEVLGDPHALDL